MASRCLPGGFQVAFQVVSRWLPGGFQVWLTPNSRWLLLTPNGPYDSCLETIFEKLFFRKKLVRCLKNLGKRLIQVHQSKKSIPFSLLKQNRELSLNCRNFMCPLDAHPDAHPFQVASRWLSRWLPGGFQVTSRWLPGGFQMASR